MRFLRRKIGVSARRGRVVSRPSGLLHGLLPEPGRRPHDRGGGTDPPRKMVNVYQAKITYRSQPYQMLLYAKSLAKREMTLSTDLLLDVLSPLGPRSNVRKIGSRLVEKGLLEQLAPDSWRITEAGLEAIASAARQVTGTPRRKPPKPSSTRKTLRR